MSLPKNNEQGKTNLSPASDVAVGRRWNNRCMTMTAEGRSAIAVVAVHGPDALEIVSQCFQPAAKTRFLPGQIRFGRWIAGDNAEGESVVVTPLRLDCLEIHCHGGMAAVQRIMQDLQAAGACRVDSERWTVDGEIAIVQEARQVLANCLTARTAAVALDQVRGALQNWASDWLRRAGQADLPLPQLQRQAAAMVVAGAVTTRLARPFHVVLVGPPNVGKSSLMNAIVGFGRSIATEIAGTTRDVLHADTVLNGLPVRLSDTAGIRDTDEPIETQGIRQARNAAGQADCIVWVSESTGQAKDWVVAVDGLRDDQISVRVLNKVDLLGKLPDKGTWDKGTWDVATSTLTGQGIDTLIAWIADRLGGKLPKSGEPAVINQRQLDLMEQIAGATCSDRAADLLRRLTH